MTDAAALGTPAPPICPRTGRRLTVPVQTVRSSPGHALSAELPGHGRAASTGHPPDATEIADVVVPAAPRRSRKARLLRVAALAAAIAALGGAATLLPLHEIQDAARSLGWAAGPVMAGIGALLLAVLVPRTAISLACGALLGPAVGFTAALGAAMLAATATYLAGRWAGHGLLAARVGGRLHRLDGWLSQRGFSAVLLVRLLPLAPFGLIGYAYGTTSVRRHHYLLGTLVAAIPSTFSYSILGAAVTTPGEFNPLTFVPAVCGIILTSTIVYRWRRTSRRVTA